MKQPTNSVSSENLMDDNERPRSIRFPQWLWDEIDREAARCKRSAVKQMEVVLAAYYREEDANIDAGRLDRLAGRNLPKGTLESIDHHKIPKEIPPNAKRKNSKA